MVCFGSGSLIRTSFSLSLIYSSSYVMLCATPGLYKVIIIIIKALIRYNPLPLDTPSLHNSALNKLLVSIIYHSLYCW